MAVRARHGCYSNRARQKEELVRQHEPTHAVRFVRSYGDVGVLRARKSQQVVCPSVRSIVCARVGLRVSTRGLAIRIGRGGLVHRGGAAMLGCCGAIPLNDYRQAFQL
jgi:hypothetical protein